MGQLFSMKVVRSASLYNNSSLHKAQWVLGRGKCGISTESGLILVSHLKDRIFFCNRLKLIFRVKCKGKSRDLKTTIDEGLDTLNE